MYTAEKNPDRHVRLILNTLESGYKPTHPNSRFDVYQLTRWSIRIRVIEPGLSKVDLIDRDQPVWDIFASLPDDTFQKISLVFLLDPEELEDAPINDMFEADLAAKLKRQRARAESSTKPSTETARAKKTGPGRSTG